MRLPRVFVLASLAIIAAGFGGGALHGVGLPGEPAFVPAALLLVTALFDLGSAALLTVITARTRERAMTVLVLMFLTLAILDVAILLTLPQPDGASLILPGNDATPYLALAMFAVVPLATIWYAAERRRQIVLTPATVWRVLRICLPCALVATVIGTALLIAAAAHLPSLADAGTERFAFHDSPPALADLALTVVAIVILHRSMIAQPAPRRIDYAVALTLLASACALAIEVSGDHRFGVSGAVARLLILVAGTFVFTAAVRSLLDLLTEGLRIEADVLRAEATAFQQNVAVEASLVKSRFVAMVSHELRTPLSGIAGMTELLERTELNDRQLAFTNVIRSSVDNLLRIVNDLLDFSRVESGTIEFEERSLDVATVVEQTVALFREQARLRGVRMDASIDPALPESIIGDETRIKQVLQNLLNNAVRFTSEGSIRVEVTRVRTTNDQDFVRFRVIDTGIGISESAIGRIFRPFMQEDASTSRRFGGTGLGLTIARSLVEMMGGTIGVESTPGAGSTFTFFIPCRAAPGSTPASPASDVPARGRERKALAARNARVLVADDNDINQQLLVAQLDTLGLRPDVVGDGVAAVEAARQQTYDLIFMDCQMPAMDGFEATRTIRSEGGPSHRAAIVAVTANVLPGYRDVCIAAGMNDYLGKPVLLDALTAIVVRWLPLDGDAARVPLAVERRSTRERLLAIFKNDEAEVDALVARSHEAIAAGLVTLGALIDAGDERGTARLAHKLKGIAVEIGRDDLASDLHEIEIAASQNVWGQARVMHGRLQAAIAK